MRHYDFEGGIIMAVYCTFAAANYQQAAQAAAQVLEASGVFDAVSLEGSVVSCTYGGETAAVFTYSSGRIDVTFGAYSMYAADIDAFWIGGTKNGVLLDHHNRYVNPTDFRLYSIAVGRSQSGIPMLMFHQLGVGSSAASNYELTCDALSAPEAVTDPALLTNAYYSKLTGECTVCSGKDSVASADKIYRYGVRQTNVPVDAMCVVEINGTEYLTDGCFAVQDSLK